MLYLSESVNSLALNVRRAFLKVLGVLIVHMQAEGAGAGSMTCNSWRRLMLR